MDQRAFATTVDTAIGPRAVGLRGGSCQDEESDIEERFFKGQLYLFRGLGLLKLCPTPHPHTVINVPILVRSLASKTYGGATLRVFFSMASLPVQCNP